MANDQTKSALAAQVGAVIRRLRGVLSASVETDPEGQIIEEIHVLADQTRSREAVRRDVETAVTSALGLPVDHRRISVEPIREGKEQPELSGRLRLAGVTISVDEQTVEARVTLEYGDSVYSGVAAAPSYDCDELKLVGSATVQGIEEFLHAASTGQGTDVILSLRDVRLVASETGQVIVAWMRLVRGGSEETLVGCARVRAERWRAAASAALAGVNRKLPRLLS
jgi:hypothetical protein